MTGSKHNGGIVQNTHLLCTKFLRRETLDFDERTEDQFHSIVAGDIVVRRLVAGGLGLGYQNLFNHQCPKNLFSKNQLLSLKFPIGKREERFLARKSTKYFAKKRCFGGKR